MAVEQHKVREIVARAVNKQWDVPEFQREFVWDPEQVKKLAESLYRDYPIGSFLLWDSSEYQQTKTAQGAQASLWIVDGQQRTTALCLLLGQKPYWWDNPKTWNDALERYDVMVNLFPDADDKSLEFALRNPIRYEDPHWISIREVLSKEKSDDVSSLAGKIVDSILKNVSSDRPHDDQRWELFTKVHSRLHGLWQIRERDIHVIRISHEAEDVAEIFARLNQEGTRIKEADVVLALAAVRNPGWVREKYLPFRSELEDRGWELDAGIFVRTITSIGSGRARLRDVSKDFWDAEKLTEAWKDTKESVMWVVKRLAEFGIVNVDLLPSKNSLVPLFVMHHYWKDKQHYNFCKAFRWFLLANWDGRYSGSALTSLNEDVRSIVEAKDFDQAIEGLVKRLRVPSGFTKDDFLNRYDRSGSRFLRLMLYLLLFRHEARDWLDQTRIGYDNTGAAVTTGFEPQWHHIYPRSVLKEAKFADDEIHALANITVLNERTNVKRLAAKLPSQYIQGIVIEDLRKHLIPDDFARASKEASLEDTWDVKRFKEFLTQRAELLARKANDFLNELLQGQGGACSSLSGGDTPSI